MKSAKLIVSARLKLTIKQYSKNTQLNKAEQLGIQNTKSYHSLVVACNTWPENEVGLFYSS